MTADVGRDLNRLIARREELLRPATEKEIAVVLGKLANHFWHPDRPEEHYRLLFEDWLADLEEYPLVALDEAAREWRRTQSWAPKVCEFRALCDGIVGRRRTELARLRFMRYCVEYHDGRCPRLLRRIGDRLVDYGDPLTNRVIEAAMAGRTKFPGDLVLALPGSAVLPQPPPVAPSDIAALADELEHQAQRQRVLRILLTGGVRIPEIEAGQMLELTKDAARKLVEERRAADRPDGREN